jgi:2-keto-4-pentenoate hydratase/2-oxohepta-3-ene-1,7-dioic acid hydratase in catechol pathway
MRLVSYRSDGQESFGAVVDDGVIDLAAALGGRYAQLSDVLTPDGLDQVRAVLDSGRPDHGLDGLTYLPVIPRPSRILCVGVNYRNHAAEAARDVAPYPSIFLRLVESVVGHEQPILRPSVSVHLDYEGELALVIGRPGRRITRAQAMEHIAGYSCFNDASVRDWQRHNPGPTPGKNFYHCGSFGPWLVTADEIPDPSALTLSTHVNGVEMQHTTTDLLIHDIPTIIEYVSAFTPLQTGDVISTGTPAGVQLGRKEPNWLKPGDVVEITITGIGTLRNVITDDAGEG